MSRTVRGDQRHGVADAFHEATHQIARFGEARIMAESTKFRGAVWIQGEHGAADNRRTSVSRCDQVHGPDRQPQWVEHRAITFVENGSVASGITISADSPYVFRPQDHWYPVDAVSSPKRYSRQA